MHRFRRRVGLGMAFFGVSAVLTIGQVTAQHGEKNSVAASTTALSSTNATQVEDDPDEPTQEEKDLRERVRGDFEIRAKQELAEREAMDEKAVGRVFSTDEEPLSGIEILVFEGGKQLDQKFVTDKHGRFEVPKRWRSSDHYLTLVARDGSERLGWFDFFLHAHSDNGQKYANSSFKIIMLPLDRTVRGRLTDDAGNPLGKIRIQIESLQHPVNYASFHWKYQSLNGESLIPGTITDDAGWYELKLPDNTHAQLCTVHADWVGKQITVTRENDRIANTTLEHAAKVAGRVVDSRTGRPIAGVTIAAETNEPKMQAGGWNEARTDSDGNYLIGGLSAGQFNIVVLKSRFKTLTAPAVVRKLTTGQTQRADFSLSLGNRLTGRVVDAKTQFPIARCHVNYNGPARPGGAVLSVETNDAGEFEFVVPPGKSRIELGESREDVPGQSVEIDVTEGRDPEPVILKAGRKLDSGDMKVFVGPPLDRRISVNLQKVPLKVAVQKMCQAAMALVELSDEVDSVEVPVTLQLELIPLRGALSRVLKPFKELTFSVDDDGRILVNQRANSGDVTKNEGTGQSHRSDLTPSSGRQTDVDPRLDQDYEWTVNEAAPLLEILNDIAKRSGLVLKIDEAEIWADELDPSLSTKVEINTNQLYRNKTQTQYYSADWERSMMHRDDGTITGNEILSYLLRAMVLDYYLVGDVLHVGTYEHVQRQKRAMVSDPKTILNPTETGLLTRVLSPLVHVLWKPVELKVELRNSSNTPQSFDPLITSPNQFLQVIGPDGKPVRFLGQAFKEVRTRIQIKPDETVTLFETENLETFFDLSQVGSYSIRLVNGSAANSAGESSVSEIPASPTRRFFIDENSQTSLRHFGERLNAAKPQDIRLFNADDGSFRITRLSQKANPDGSPIELDQAFVELRFVNDPFSSEKMRDQGNPYELLARNSTGYRFVYLKANEEARATWPTLLKFIRKEVTSLVQPERIVVVGQIDFDGDGQSDREQFSRLLNDARILVDVEMDDDGNLRLQYDKIYREATRFLVLGNIDKIANKKVRARTSRFAKYMIRHARESNVRIVNLSDFLAYVKNPAVSPAPAKIDQ